jgi:hypothetical protein
MALCLFSYRKKDKLLKDIPTRPNPTQKHRKNHLMNIVMELERNTLR